MWRCVQAPLICCTLNLFRSPMRCSHTHTLMRPLTISMPIHCSVCSTLVTVSVKNFSIKLNLISELVRNRTYDQHIWMLLSLSVVSHGEHTTHLCAPLTPLRVYAAWQVCHYCHCALSSCVCDVCACASAVVPRTASINRNIADRFVFVHWRWVTMIERVKWKRNDGDDGTSEDDDKKKFEIQTRTT